MESEPKEDALELISKFSRAANFPKEELDVIALAQGLARASARTGVLMSRIVQECLDTSQWCPTDHDMLKVAESIAGPPQIMARSAFGSICGKPMSRQSLPLAISSGRRPWLRNGSRVTVG